MSEGKDPVKKTLIALCAVAAATAPFLEFIGPAHSFGSGLMPCITNLICVAGFYFGSRKLLERLETQQQLNPDINVFRKIHDSVCSLSLLGLSTITMAWAISDFIHR